MVLGEVTRCAEAYDIWSYHCANCGGDFNMVCERMASDISVSFANAARLREGVQVNQQMLQSALGQQ